jgi:5-hydroxyisourate hydrolase-like protein (transthyretin family)
VSDAGTRSAVYDVFAADVLLNDVTPVAVGNVGGPLLAGGTLAGAQSVSFVASDVGSGVYKGSLTVDGVVVTESVLDAAGGACADLGVSPDGLPSYLNTRPCRASVNGLLTLNTDLLSPGSHELTIRAGDAAGNQTVVRTATISVVGPRPAGTPNGSSASRFAKLAAGFAGRRAARVRRFGFRALPTVTGRLVDEHGNPIGGAAVDVLVRDRRAGAERQRIATATTGADGTFRVQLPSGPSRTITVQYTAFSGDPKPSATATLSARVRAGVSAGFTPRSVRLGRRLRLSGRLRYLPRGSVLVRIQARNGRRWQTIDTVKTGSDGRYRWTYRFQLGASAGRRYQFRVKVDSPIYPFSPGTSRTVVVRVR